MKKLEQKRNRILARMGEITTLRQGSLTEQYVTRTRNKQRRRHGPYYVHTWYEEGKKRTEHISHDEVRQMQSHIKNYQKIKDLFDDLLDVTEQITKGGNKNKQTVSVK